MGYDLDEIRESIIYAMSDLSSAVEMLEGTGCEDEHDCLVLDIIPRLKEKIAWIDNKIDERANESDNEIWKGRLQN